ncbi:MAG: nuclear transport factor 2 family protein [Acidobacteriota bacterium]
MKRLIILFALLFLLTFGIVSAQTVSKDQSALVALVDQMARAQMAYDAAALDRIFTQDYIEISPVGEFDPRDKVLGFYKPELKPPDRLVSTVEVSDLSVRSYGKFAVVIAKFTYEMKMDGKPMPPRRIRATIVCRQENHSWKIASSQYTGIRPPQPPKS